MNNYFRTENILFESIPLYKGHFEADGNELRDFEIDLVDSTSHRKMICDLLDRMYGWRGYKNGFNVLEHSETFTFAASIESEIIATLTLNIDSSRGLTADSTFNDVIEAIRQEPGAKLCELTRFASQPSENSRQVLACLFHTIFIFGTERFACTDLFIEVNPRHVRFYEVMLGFRKCGDLRTNESVDAPSQLMRLKVRDIGHNIELRAVSGSATGTRSFYALFLPAREQNEVRFRMRQRQQASLAGALQSEAARNLKQTAQSSLTEYKAA